jgi:type 1 fimbria pilin
MRARPVLLLGILPAAILAAWAGAASAADRGTIRLAGVVPQSCTLSVADRGVVLDLAAGERTSVVATIEERCNAPGGYTVKVSSRNGGLLSSSEGGSLPYTLAYDGARAPQGRGGDLVAQRGQPGWQTRDLAVTAGRSGRVAAGSYSDLVTVTIEAR